MIAFVGSVFSPYYAWARRKRPAAPENHVAINVALYGPKGRWAMTERGAQSLDRAATHFTVGPSSLRWDDGVLTVDIDETTVPIPSRLRGTVKLRTASLANLTAHLDPAQRHVWRPIAPHAAIEVNFQQPGLNWSGQGYFDMNHGTEPLEWGFRSWTWSRAPSRRGAVVLYDVVRRDGSQGSLALAFDATGASREIAAPAAATFPRTLWGIDRPTRSDGTVGIMRTLEDTPFYARSLARWNVAGEDVSGFHESLDLTRFERGIVQAMLPFRMPRRAAWRRQQT